MEAAERVEEGKLRLLFQKHSRNETGFLPYAVYMRFLTSSV